MSKPERVEIGFSGGQVMATRLEEDRLKELVRQVQSASGWYELVSTDGAIVLDLREVVFVKTDAPEHKVGFITE